jgi:hypothetical protein
MRCVADRAIGVAEFGSLEALPAGALALFGGDAFSTEAWYRSVAAAALDPGAKPCFQVVARDGVALAVFPMLRDRGGVAALTTPYTVLWSPLLRPDLDEASLIGVGRAIGRTWRRTPATRLDALQDDAAWLAPLLRGLGRSGLTTLRFEHFGNWHIDVAGIGWERYLAGRPGQLRSTATRGIRRLIQRMGANFTLVEGLEGLEAGLAAYDQVYRSSWKQPEPYPHFNVVMMREAAAAGTLRLGVLSVAGAPVAVQFWLLHGAGRERWAGVQKLAHDETHRQLAPGTVLTALIIRHLLEVDRVGELDFGRGDDEYKQLWTDSRRARIGVVLATPWQPRGLAVIARHRLGQVRRMVARP